MAQFVPSRNDIIWLDFEPPRGKEIGKYRPALVLSSKAYNRKTGLLICCPISSSIRRVPTEVPVGNLGRPSVVTVNLVQARSWKDRQAKLIAVAEPGVLEQVLLRLIPLLGAEQVIEKYLGSE